MTEKFVPISGKERWFSYKLNSAKCVDEYNPYVNPTTLIEYANNAFRWFHTNIPTNIHIVNRDGDLEDEIPLSDTYLNLTLFTTSKYNGLLGGMLKQKQRMYKVGYTGQVRTEHF